MTFQQPELRKDPMRCALIPKDVNVFPMCTKPQYTIGEAIAMVMFYKLNFKFALKSVEKMCRRDISRFFGAMDFDHIIQYDGYGKNMIHLFRLFDCKRTIFVHNDMLRELATKNIQHRLSLEKAYNDYDNVACVTKDIVPMTAKISGRTDNIKVVNNCQNYKAVLKRGEDKLHFDEDTLCRISCEELEKILSDSSRKIVNIGRFSDEKGHDMLIEAFARYVKEQPDSRLIIIGGYGRLYEKTCELAERSGAGDRIIIIKSMSNPMPVLKQCDLFVLSSRHEALPMTIFEADTLGVPVITTDIPGPSSFVREYGGYVCECSADGIYKGLCDYSQGKIKAMNIDFEEYNRKISEQFEKLF